MAKKTVPAPAPSRKTRTPAEPGAKRRKVRGGGSAPTEAADLPDAPTEPTEGGEDLSSTEEGELRSRLRGLREEATATLSHGRDLAKVIDLELYKKWGYKNFAEYAQGELDFEIRRAKSVVAMARVADVIGTSRPDADELVAKMGLVKVTIASKLLNAETIGEWAERAASTSCREFASAVKAEKGSSATPAGDSVNWTAKITSEAKDVIEEAMTVAGEIIAGLPGSEDNASKGQCLEFMASQFIATFGADPDTFLASAIEIMENRLGVRIVVAKDNKVIYGTIDDLSS